MSAEDSVLKTEKPKQESTTIAMVAFSIFIATANQIYYKLTLNAFSSPTTNYGFFVNQFSTLMYTVQAVIVSAGLVWQQPDSWKESLKSPQSIFIIMGLLDGASSTLSTVSGAFCPGELQTILNQSIIPMTMVSAYAFIHTKFQGFQIWGSCLIILGAIVASSDYFFVSGGDDDQSAQTTRGHPVAIMIFIMSILPSAFSNVYKEKCMKEDDMNEVHTTTFVSFWQILVGFAFLPILALPSLGGVPPNQMWSQLGAGWVCFWEGENLNDPDDDSCEASFVVFIVYIVINFIYNFMLLIITKRGSAVLLVISQALSLPVTNITFSIPAVMGKDAEALSINDLMGLVLVCIGFLIYSGFGFAEKFMVVQGPPGQMTFASVDKGNTLVVNKDVGNNPRSLAKFLMRMSVQKSIEARRAARKVRAKEQQRLLLEADSVGEGSETDALTGGPLDRTYGATGTQPPLPRLMSSAMDDVAATRMAIQVAVRATEIMRGRLDQLTHSPVKASTTTTTTPERRVGGLSDRQGSREFKPLGSTHSGSMGPASGWSFYAPEPPSTADDGGLMPPSSPTSNGQSLF